MKTTRPWGSYTVLAGGKGFKVKIVEVQCGDYLEEDDIERLEDDYGRRKEYII